MISCVKKSTNQEKRKLVIISTCTYSVVPLVLLAKYSYATMDTSNLSKNIGAAFHLREVKIIII